MMAMSVAATAVAGAAIYALARTRLCFGSPARKRCREARQALAVEASAKDEETRAPTAECPTPACLQQDDGEKIELIQTEPLQSPADSPQQEDGQSVERIVELEKKSEQLETELEKVKREADEAKAKVRDLTSTFKQELHGALTHLAKEEERRKELEQQSVKLRESTDEARRAQEECEREAARQIDSLKRELSSERERVAQLEQPKKVEASVVLARHLGDDDTDADGAFSTVNEATPVRTAQGSPAQVTWRAPVQLSGGSIGDERRPVPEEASFAQGTSPPAPRPPVSGGSPRSCGLMREQAENLSLGNSPSSSSRQSPQVGGSPRLQVGVIPPSAPSRSLMSHSPVRVNPPQSEFVHDAPERRAIFAAPPGGAPQGIPASAAVQPGFMLRSTHPVPGARGVLASRVPVSQQPRSCAGYWQQEPERPEAPREMSSPMVAQRVETFQRELSLPCTSPRAVRQPVPYSPRTTTSRPSLGGLAVGGAVCSPRSSRSPPAQLHHF